MPLKILHIASGDRWAGAEVQLFTLLKALKHCDCLPSAILLNDGELANRLREENIPVFIISESEHNFLSLLKKLRQRLLLQRPDLIHTHRQKENILGALGNKLSINVPSCRTIHGSPEFNPNIKQRIQRALDDFVGKRLQQCVVAVSDDICQSLESKFGKNHVATIYNGVDIEAIKLEARISGLQQIDNSSFNVGIVGRLESIKRIDLFLGIADKLLRSSREIEWKFHIVGDGGMRAELENITKNLQIEESVYFHGHQAHVAAIIDSLDVVVMCSDHEGMPMTALETIAIGTSLVAHDVGGLHTLGDFEGVHLVKENDEKGYLSILSDLASKTETKTDAGEFVRRFSSIAMAEKTVAMYKRLLA